VLLDRERPSPTELATFLAGWDATETGQMATPDDHAELLVELHHRHLPLLHEAGLVSYDREDETVTIAHLDDDIAALIRTSVDQDTDQ
jgi:hypothetical protein